MKVMEFWFSDKLRVVNLEREYKLNNCLSGTSMRLRALLANCLYHAGVLLGLLFEPEDGGDMFRRHLGWISTDYTALHRRR
jgi:hypothetical protein